MKTPIAWLSLGLLASALTAAGVTSFLAWDSITARSELTKHPTLAPMPIATSSPAPIATAVVQKLPAESSDHLTSDLNQDENHYLFDLAQSLQAEERDRLTLEQQLDVAHNILSWLKQGADYWGVREKFDAAYRGTVLGDYAHNRDVYIRFATQHLAPDHLATLKQPGVLDLDEVITELPTDLPIPDGSPDGTMAEMLPYPDAYVEPYVPAPAYMVPPEPYPYPYHPQPYGRSGPHPYAVPYPRANPGPAEPRIPRLRSISSRG